VWDECTAAPAHGVREPLSVLIVSRDIIDSRSHVFVSKRIYET
jgi:hypothetical protein